MNATNSAPGSPVVSETQSKAGIVSNPLLQRAYIMSEKDIVGFLREVARYFDNRDTGGEDAAFWANVMNAKNCREAADTIERLRDDLRRSVERDSGGYAPDGKTWKTALYEEAERRGQAEAALAAALTQAAEMREALRLADELIDPVFAFESMGDPDLLKKRKQFASAIRELKVGG